MKISFNLIIILFLSNHLGYSFQEPIDENIMSLKEYMAMVKKFHPLVKQANLVLDESEAKLLKSRGAFDPKVEADYSKKTYHDTEYYNKLHGTFKIPTWYGVTFKAALDDNEGYYLNPENNTPDDGLYSAGVSLSLAKGLFMNERMAMLKQSRLFVEQAKADRQIQVNQILFEAAKAYFNWLQHYRNFQTYDSFLENAQIRFDGIKRGYIEGEQAAVDTLEAHITLDTRKLNLEKSRINYLKATLELSNYLWLEDDVPVELQENMFPDLLTIQSIDDVLDITDLDIESYVLDNHPKLISLDYKYQGLEVDRRLKVNNLLPDLTLDYNFLSETPREVNSFNGRDYKSGITFKLPLFLRKERGDLRLANVKLQDLEYEIVATNLSLRNKITALTNEIESYAIQNSLANKLVIDNATMVNAEERKFFLGESSLFVVNSRESKLIETQIKAISVENDYLNSKASLFNILATLPEEE